MNARINYGHPILRINPYYHVVSHRRQEISDIYIYIVTRYVTSIRRKLVDERVRVRVDTYRYHVDRDSPLESRIVSFHVSVVARIVLIIA